MTPKNARHVTFRTTQVLHGRLLTYFDEVAKVGSIRGASERFGIAAYSVNPWPAAVHFHATGISDS
jgi:hypothetical protein